jgi:hypothetical protein
MHIMNCSIFPKVLFGFAFLSASSSQVFAWQAGPVASETLVKPVESTVVPAVNLSPQMNDLYLNQWIHSDKNRNISGSVVALVGKDTISLAKAKVSLLKSGRLEYSDDTDIDGDFLIEGVAQGVYTLVAETGDSLAIFSLTVLDEVVGKHLPGQVQVRVMPTSGGRANEIISGQTLPKDFSHPVPDQDPLQAVRKTNESHQIVIDAAGNLKGQLSKATERVDMSSMSVFVMKDGAEVARVRASSDGKFVVRGLTAGCYGLVAAGEQGVAVLGFCATNQDLAMRNSGKEKWVAFNAKTLPVCNVEIGDAIGNGSNSDAIDQVAADESTPPLAPTGALGMGPGFGAPMMGGGGGGSMGGGGGTFGGWGSLAGIGGLIAVGVVLATDDNNDSDTIQSPVVP